MAEEKSARPWWLWPFPAVIGAIEKSYRQVVGDRRTHRPDLGVLMVDIDHFDAITERFGADGGDVVLQAVVDRISSCLRDEDKVGRWGGEEFVVLLPNVDPGGIENVTARIRACVAATPIDIHGTPIDVAVTIGGAVGSRYEDVERVMADAAEALTAAKPPGDQQAD